MKVKIIKNVTYDRVCLFDDEGNDVSHFILVKENDRCYYDQLEWLLKPNGMVLYLSDFGTEKKYRRRGYAKTLIRYALEYYGDEIIYLGVSSSNEQFSNEDLIKFYESVGFKKINYELPHQFMVYDKFGKISDELLNEKIIKLTPTNIDSWGKRHVIFPAPLFKKEGEILVKTSMFIGMCAILKHRMHNGYCKLFTYDRHIDKETGIYSYKMQPLFDKDGNEVLIKYDSDCLSVFASYNRGGGNDWYDLEIDSNYGIG